MGEEPDTGHGCSHVILSNKEETHPALVVQHQQDLTEHVGSNPAVSDHHELLKLVEGAEVSPSLQELAGGNEVAAAGLQAGIQLLQHGLEDAEASPLQTGLQQTLQEHLFWAFLPQATEAAQLYITQQLFTLCQLKENPKNAGSDMPGGQTLTRLRR